TGGESLALDLHSDPGGDTDIVGGERRLLYAMLVGAIESYRKGGGTPWNREYLEARRWLFSEVNPDFFSFMNVCEMLGIDPTRLRRKLRESSARRRGFTSGRFPVATPFLRRGTVASGGLSRRSG
ncbi:MAG: hypothetical protein ACREQY_22575, partial [Candidatus Binatia bacterium]